MYSSQDRTNDFSQIINKLKSSTKAPQNGFIVQQSKIKSKRHQLISQRSKFTTAAKGLTTSLAGTCLRLEKLGDLVKSTSLFDDKSEEIQELTIVLKEDMANLSHEIKALQLLCTEQNGEQSSSHSRNVVQSIQSRLSRMSLLFNETLHNRVQSLKEQSQRRAVFSNPKRSDMPFTRKTDCQPKVPSLLLMEEEMSQSASSSSLSIHSTVRNQLFSHQVGLIDRTDDYLDSRNENIRNVERTIIDMSKIFEQLSVLIHEQGEQVDMIHSHVEETSLNVEGGHNELLKLYQSATSNRWLMIKVFGVLFVSAVIFVVLLA